MKYYNIILKVLHTTQVSLLRLVISKHLKYNNIDKFILLWTPTLI
ncbi:hypothetical protein FM107_16645 [Sphingobacterium sp. JB170]|nr:hypothetical protein FM107_16645 [Sphingobacterium sp. JB170]